jgi:hypothetical protein
MERTRLGATDLELTRCRCRNRAHRLGTRLAGCGGGPQPVADSIEGDSPRTRSRRELDRHGTLLRLGPRGGNRGPRLSKVRRDDVLVFTKCGTFRGRRGPHERTLGLTVFARTSRRA